MKLLKYSKGMFIIIMLHHSLAASIIIRSATLQDLPATLEFDRRVSYEFFKPLFIQGYSAYPMGRNPDHCLDIELAFDEKFFPEIIEKQSKDRLLIAVDEASHAVVGFLLFHTEAATHIHLDLLMVDQNYRGQGIGKKLIAAGLDTFPRATRCTAYLLKYCNQAACTFYEKLGFICIGDAPVDEENMHGVPLADVLYTYALTIQDFAVSQAQ